MVNATKNMHLGIGLIMIALLGNILAFPQSSRFDQKQAIFTDSKGQPVGQAETLASRFETGDSKLNSPPANSIGFYPYGSGTVPYLIRNPYPEVQTFYGYNSYKYQPDTNSRIGEPLKAPNYQNGGFGYKRYY